MAILLHFFHPVNRATVIQHQSAKVGHANMGSVALPAILRAGDTGNQGQYSTGSMQKAQYTSVSHQLGSSALVNGSVSVVCMKCCSSYNNCPTYQITRQYPILIHRPFILHLAIMM